MSRPDARRDPVYPIPAPVAASVPAAHVENSGGASPALTPPPPVSTIASVPEAGVPASKRALGRRLRAYLALTKPRIIELLIVTTLPAMVLAGAGLPPLGLVLATVGGGALAAASANRTATWTATSTPSCAGPEAARW